MDKVIIDKIDVSECRYAITPKKQCPNKPMPYAKETSCISCKEHNTKLNFCKKNPYCYFKQLKRLQAENKKLKYYLNKIREDELNSMDVEWDEYITECSSTEYTNVITFVELALGERDE